jgi:hypothetical protein
MKHKSLISKTIFLALLCSFAFKSLQAFDFEDSISLRKVPKNCIAFVFNLDNRFSFAGSDMITIHGFRTGIKWREKHKFGVALNWIGSRNFIELAPLPVGEDLSLINALPKQGRLLYGYAGIFYEYSFYQKKHWAMSVPLQFGTGKAGVDIVNPLQENEFIERKLSRFLLFEPSVNIDYKIIRFLGIGTGIGYRFAYSDQHIVQHKLTQPVYILKVKVYLGEIFRSVRKKDYRLFYFE